jgi:hypothetical protein
VKYFTTLMVAVLTVVGYSFGAAYESSTKLNSLEWDETSHAVYAWMDNPTVGEFDRLYMYDWNLSGNSIERAKAIYSTLLTAYTAGLPIKIWHTTQAEPTNSGWGTKGVIGAVRLGDSQAP